MTAVTAVLFVAHTGQVSGAEQVMLALAGQAHADGYAVTVACPRGPLVDALPEGVAHAEIPPLGLEGERGLARVSGGLQLLRRCVIAGRALAPLARSPRTAIVVNSMFALPAVRLARPPQRAAWLVHDTIVSTKQRVMTRLGRPVVRHAVAVSEATAAPLRAARIPVTVAHNGVRWPVSQLGGQLHDPPVVGMLALLTPWKGHRVLLEAAKSLPDVHVELAGGSFPGDRPYIAELEAMAASPELSGRVRFLGHIDPETAMRGWDVVVSASTSPEAGPLSVLEAMAHGLPVIGTDHGGTSEFLADGAGILVPPSDAQALAEAIAAVLADGRLRDDIASAARERISREHDITRTLPILMCRLMS